MYFTYEAGSICRARSPVDLHSNCIFHSILQCYKSLQIKWCRHELVFSVLKSMSFTIWQSWMEASHLDAPQSDLPKSSTSILLQNLQNHRSFPNGRTRQHDGSVHKENMPITGLPWHGIAVSCAVETSWWPDASLRPTAPRTMHDNLPMLKTLKSQNPICK